MTRLICGSKELDLSKTQVMGILNVTPDSFSDGGNLFSDKRLSVDKALLHAARMLDEGATIIDVGGESTRPGAEPVSLQEEMDRVLPVVERLKAELDALISVDTSAPEVMTESARLGAGILNDVRALGQPGALEAASATGLPVCVMHMQGSPATMQRAPSYENVFDEVKDFLVQQIKRAEIAGIPREKIIIDPGFGFGKTLEHNLQLLNRMDQFLELGVPILSGTSRKTMIGQVLDKPANERLAGGLATVALAVERGARIIRVHDVAATVDVVRMTEAIISEKLVG